MTAALTLYYGRGTCAQAVLIALYEAQAEFDLKIVNMAEGEQRSADFLALNPKGRVPALRTSEGVLSEVPALLLYVAQTHEKAQLAPLGNAFALAHMQELNMYLASTVHVNHAHNKRGNRWADDEVAQASMRAKVAANMRDCFDLIEQHYLSDKPWVLGDQYSVADGYLFTVASWLESDGVNIKQFPRVYAHTERMLQREAVQKALQQ